MKMNWKSRIVILIVFAIMAVLWLSYLGVFSSAVYCGRVIGVNWPHGSVLLCKQKSDYGDSFLFAIPKGAVADFTRDIGARLETIPDYDWITEAYYMGVKAPSAPFPCYLASGMTTRRHWNIMVNPSTCEVIVFIGYNEEKGFLSF